ncbi:hypothetical protein [Paenibacillus chungangensis]|uniref:Uncharacterized protein n=1 Tax=Paenibacillus chungangensis TaxID=696535 RepID=A0ABW3HKF4_9BACL
MAEAQKNFNRHKESSSEDLRSKFDSFVRDKDATEKMITDYLNAVNPSAKALIEALKAFGESQKESTLKVQDLLKQAMAILEKELDRDLTETQRDNVYKLILEILKEARLEAQDNRSFNTRLLAFGGGALLVLVGGSIYLASNGKKKDAIVKGVQMLLRR